MVQEYVQALYYTLDLTEKIALFYFSTQEYPKANLMLVHNFVCLHVHVHIYNYVCTYSKNMW